MLDNVVRFTSTETLEVLQFWNHAQGAEIEAECRREVELTRFLDGQILPNVTSQYNAEPFVFGEIESVVFDTWSV